jgi:bifunctional DNA-binding transcriptional regulator/antitoxin component of YhaV-PrlF toxin-antitoxin module
MEIRKRHGIVPGRRVEIENTPQTILLEKEKALPIGLEYPEHSWFQSQVQEHKR